MLARTWWVAGLVSLAAIAADEPKALGPVEARKHVGKEITVRMEVKASKDEMQIRGEIYLDAEEDYKHEKNFAVAITKKGAASLKEAGIADPAMHFKGKTITAKGKVKEVDGVPRIEIDEATQLSVVAK